jgi:hypothetical protein
MHPRAPAFGGHHQDFGRGLPFLKLLLGLLQLHDLAGGVIERDELAAPGKGIVEGSFPAAISFHATALSSLSSPRFTIICRS